MEASFSAFSNHLSISMLGIWLLYQGNKVSLSLRAIQQLQDMQ